MIKGFNKFMTFLGLRANESKPIKISLYKSTHKNKKLVKVERCLYSTVFNYSKFIFMIIMYGIKNCDTVKKARAFLDKNNAQYEFIDLRDDGVNPIQLRAWIKELGWDKVINKRSTTWRNLPDKTKENMNETLAIVVAEDQPTIIKRPVLELSDQVLIGFSENSYRDNAL